MKNPFVAIALAIAVAREKYFQAHPEHRPLSFGRDRTPGPVRPAGTKIARLAKKRLIGKSRLS